VTHRQAAVNGRGSGPEVVHPPAQRLLHDAELPATVATARPVLITSFTASFLYSGALAPNGPLLNNQTGRCAKGPRLFFTDAVASLNHCVEKAALPMANSKSAGSPASWTGRELAPEVESLGMDETGGGVLPLMSLSRWTVRRTSRGALKMTATMTAHITTEKRNTTLHISFTSKSSRIRNGRSSCLPLLSTSILYRGSPRVCPYRPARLAGGARILQSGSVYITRRPVVLKRLNGSSPIRPPDQTSLIRGGTG